MRKISLTIISILAVSFGYISFANAQQSNSWEYGVREYTYSDNGQLDGSCPENVCTGRAASITNNSESAQNLKLDLHYGPWVGNYQWGEDHNGGVIWHEIPMSVNKRTQSIPSDKTVYFRVVLREQHPVSGQWLIYHILSTPAVSNIFAWDGGGHYFLFPPQARYYNSDFQKDVSGFVMVVENSLGSVNALQ